MEEPRPQPANVPGDYFVEDGCFLTCEVPFLYAPNHFGWSLDERGQPQHCYVKRQPATPEEHARLFEAICHAETSCLMYRGRDRAIQERLVEAGEGAICVGLPEDPQSRSTDVLAVLDRRRRSPATFWRR